MLKVIHSAEELPQDVLAPAHNDFFIAEVEAVLEVQQAGHQANREFGAPGIATTRAYQDCGGAEHVLTFQCLACAMLAFKLRRHSRLDLIPGQHSRQYRQRIVQIDHGVNAAAEKVLFLHQRFPQKSILYKTFLEGFGAHDLYKNLVFMRVGGVLQERLYSGWIEYYLTKRMHFTKCTKCETLRGNDMGIKTALLVVLLSAAVSGCGGGSDVGPTVCRPTMANPDLCLSAAAAAGGSAASIKFISADTTNIALKGTGGFGRPEFSTLKFQVFDNAGKAVAGAPVNFVFSDSNAPQTVGGLTLLPSATSEGDGFMTTVVSAGTIPTSVRVVASIGGGITTLSNILVISTGVPDQNHFSLATETGNCEGRDVDQTCSFVTATLGDHFGNPAPDGTAVNFTTSGGVIGASCVTGSLPPPGATPNICTPQTCQTTNSTIGPGSGTCTVLLRASNPRPANGRVTVLAYAVGEENFFDSNGNNTYDTVDTFSDKSPDIFRDDNETGMWTPGEPCIGPNINGTCSTLGDGQYNGVLRSPQVPSAQTLYVSAQLVQTFSGSNALVSFTPASLVCPAGGTTVVRVQASDQIGNIMPAGTTIDFSTVFGTGTGTVSPASIKVPNVVLAVGQSLTVPTYSVTVGCPSPAASGQFFVTVTSPTTATITRASAPIN